MAYEGLSRSGRTTIGVLLSTGITVAILGNPVAVVQFTSLVFDWGWMNAVTLVVVIFGGSVVELMLIQFHDGRVWKQIIHHYFPTFHENKFEPTDIKLEHPDLKTIRDVLRDPVKGMFLSRFLVPSVRGFYVHSESGNVPSGYKTYQMAGGTSYVFTAQKPEKMRPIAKFFLLHEIGHATVANQVIYVRGWFVLAHSCLLLVFVALHREPGVPALLGAVALPAIWGYYLRQQKRPNQRLESMADFFALVHLAREADFRTAIARTARQFRNRAVDLRFAGKRARLLVRRAQILSRKRTGLSFRWGQDLDWSEEMVLLVPPWLGLLLLGGMLWLGAVLSITEWEEVLSVSVIWVVIPALVQCYRFVLTALAPEA